jgi:ribosome-associated protein
VKEELSISRSPVRPHTADALAATVVASLDDDKAEEVVVIDLRGRSSVTDRMVVASGRSSRQVGAMADHILEKLKAAGVSASVEGMGKGDWVLIDGGDVVVHLFRPEVRAFYDLESMWSETPVEAEAETATGRA